MRAWLLSVKTHPVVGAAIVCLSTACTPASPPTILLISVDSLRSDHLGAYGYERQTSPAIDSLAQEGVVFEKAISTTTWTLPAHASMLTSLYPEVHGANRDGTRLPDGAVLLSERLQENGFFTGAVVSAPYLHRNYGFDQGWNVYDDEPALFEERRPENFNPTHWGVTSPTVHRHALDVLEQAGDQPLFLFVHYWDVHYDYSPPPPYDTLFDSDYTGDITSLNFEFNEAIEPGMDDRDRDHLIALYDGEIAYTDMYIGQLFEVLKRQNRWDNAMVVLTADHGDEFFEHGEKGHRKNLFGSTLNVPIIVKLPSHRTAHVPRVSTPVSVVDIAPTILEVAGLPPLEWSHGTSLAALMRGEASDAPYRYASLFERVSAVLHEDLKLVTRWDLPVDHRRRLQLFDIGRDPGELTNLAGELGPAREELQSVQRRWRAVSREQARSLEHSELELDPELADRLRSLGYVR